MNYLKYLLIINFLINFDYSLISQISLNKKLNFNLAKTFDFVEIDNQGYLYLVDNDQILKFNKNGEELYSYSNKSLGEIAELDVSNSLRPVIFYKDQGLIVLLDNTLSQQEDILNLSSLNLDQANCIANSNFDNGIWFYDMSVNEIIKINSNAQVQFKSGNLSAILNNIHLPIISLQEKNGKLYAQTSNEILVFDQYGSLVNDYRISSNSKPIYAKTSILFIDEGMLNIFEMLDFSTSKTRIKTAYEYIRGDEDNLVGIKDDVIDLLEIIKN